MTTSLSKRIFFSISFHYTLSSGNRVYRFSFGKLDIKFGINKSEVRATYKHVKGGFGIV